MEMMMILTVWRRGYKDIFDNPFGVWRKWVIHLGHGDILDKLMKVCNDKNIKNSWYKLFSKLTEIDSFSQNSKINKVVLKTLLLQKLGTAGVTLSDEMDQRALLKQISDGLS